MCAEQLFDLAKNIALVLFGWLIGLLGPVIEDARKKKILLRETRQGIIADLHVARLKLTTYYYRLCLRSGKFSKELLEWVEPRLRLASHVPETSEMLKAMEEVKGFDAETLSEHGKALAKQENKSFPTLKKVELPYLTGSHGLLGALGRSTRLDALEVVSHLQSVNGEIDLAWWFYKKTLDPAAMQTNADIIENNLRDTLNSLANMCRREVELIEKLERDLTP